MKYKRFTGNIKENLKFIVKNNIRPKLDFLNRKSDFEKCSRNSQNIQNTFPNCKLTAFVEDYVAIIALSKKPQNVQAVGLWSTKLKLKLLIVLQKWQYVYSRCI